MKIFSTIICFLTLFLISNPALSQSRIKYNNQDLFLSGGNFAWVSFANDIGPGETAFNSFSETMLAVHDSGGNAMRLWLHINGSNSPEFDGTGHVSGPGEGTISDLRKLLDLAWEREVGLKLCLWSFDMLHSNNDAEIRARNRLMLEDTSYAMAYIRNSLIPMVDSLKGHPGIIAWEIFNEPEGMSNEFGWGGVEHVPMAYIQRFMNLCAGAIHRTDTSAQVTSGCWSFTALTDVPTSLTGKPGAELSELSYSDKEEIETVFKEKYGMSLTAEEIIKHIQNVSAANQNYYSDDGLIAAGGDPDGTMDFYSVHYYSALGASYSPFLRNADFWNLDKPIVVAEFAMSESHNGLEKQKMFERLYQFGYAGALAWSWTDVGLSSHANMLSAMKFMWKNYNADVDVEGISGNWPVISLINPKNNDKFPGGAEVTIEANASDDDGTIVSVEFFASDTLKIGEKNSAPYSITWTGIQDGQYALTAVATDNTGNKRTSNIVHVTVGTPAFTRIETESAIRTGSDMSIRTDASASGGRYLEMRTSTGTITWTLGNVPQAGTYEVRFGYRLSFDRPKSQFINVNGQRVAEMVFDSTLSTWLENPINVDLAEGSNTIQMELSWGWMDLDYLSVPTQIITSVEDKSELPKVYSLEQNYPNPFNPASTISYQIPASGNVKLKVYDILGNELKTLVDGFQNAGTYSLKFDGANLASGIYIYRISVNDFLASKKMTLLK